MKIQENIPLAPFTTFAVGGPGRYFAEARSEAELREALEFAAQKRLPLFVLGGGSNLVVADEGWPGLVLKIGLKGIESQSHSGETLFHVAAGENWDDLVAVTVERNCAGIECLSGIPGTVGGTPVQNVGAYGQEVSQTISTVQLMEIATGKVSELKNEECGFTYRSSIFNTNQRDRYIVLEAVYRLKQGGQPTIQYADLQKFFADAASTPSLRQVRDAVRLIRQSKAMLLVPGDEDCRSAGSFFKNPLVSADEAERIQVLAHERFPGKLLPQYAADDGRVKLSAAWLVEQAGFPKGYARGPVGISRKHSLAIVNRGGAGARDIIALKQEIEQKVLQVWGVRLQPEPVFVGFEQAKIKTKLVDQNG
ncbi:MAG TPA: UDP-N-acetylmuramate dehydrogenase [Candidatus Angelobacter sp.]|nr:UDP-N-acetylmuramate dehydrogenase [Candidatus Angelobacter sp.]